MTYKDRDDAGRQLAEALTRYRGQDVVVLGLPRGGVPVGFLVAQALGAPLDVIVVRKLGLPYQPELAMGAIGEGGVRVLNEEVLRSVHVTPSEISAVEAAERAELNRRVTQLRRGHQAQALDGRTVIIVDDGVATGTTARAACQIARARGADRVVLAVPIGSSHTVANLRSDADEVVCLKMPHWFSAVGQAYRNFEQVSDDEVVELLRRAHALTLNGGPPHSAGVAGDREVQVQAGATPLAGHLTVPDRPVGVVVFAHGSGSSRFSPRNRHVAQSLNKAGLGTLLVDLLTSREEHDRALVFDIRLLADRLVELTRWLRTEPECEGLSVGYFGASTGAGAALWAAADPTAQVSAVVSRGGRPDLAGARLAQVQAPTLLIVGGRDQVVLDLNRTAKALLPGTTRLAVVPGATHLFEEPGALDQVAQLARDWFLTYLRG